MAHRNIAQAPDRFQWERALFRSGHSLPSPAVAVALALASFTTDGETYVGLEKLGLAVGIHSRTARRWLLALLGAGWIEKSGKNGRSHVWRLAIPAGIVHNIPDTCSQDIPDTPVIAAGSVRPDPSGIPEKAGSPGQHSGHSRPCTMPSTPKTETNNQPPEGRVVASQEAPKTGRLSPVPRPPSDSAHPPMPDPLADPSAYEDAIASDYTQSRQIPASPPSLLPVFDCWDSLCLPHSKARRGPAERAWQAAHARARPQEPPPTTEALCAYARSQASVWRRKAAQKKSEGDPAPWEKAMPSMATIISERRWATKADPDPGSDHEDKARKRASYQASENADYQAIMEQVARERAEDEEARRERR